MVAEAAKMKKDAEKMDPTVKRPGSARAELVEVADAPKAKRTRGPNKVKTV